MTDLINVTPEKLKSTAVSFQQTVRMLSERPQICFSW